MNDYNNYLFVYLQMERGNMGWKKEIRVKRRGKESMRGNDGGKRERPVQHFCGNKEINKMLMHSDICPVNSTQTVKLPLKQ